MVLWFALGDIRQCLLVSSPFICFVAPGLRRDHSHTCTDSLCADGTGGHSAPRAIQHFSHFVQKLGSAVGLGKYFRSPQILPGSTSRSSLSMPSTIRTSIGGQLVRKYLAAWYPRHALKNPIP